MLLVNAFSAPSSIHRIGLFAGVLIPQGVKVTEHKPGFDLAISESEISTLPAPVREQVLRHAFFNRRVGQYFLDSDDGRFTNHSDDANTRQIGLASYATRDIFSGEEITLNYGDLDGDLPVEPLASFKTGWVINGVTGLYLDRTATGWGLFAAKPLASGEHILRFTGPVLSLAETLALGAWSMYPVQVGPDRFVECDSPGAFLNHSCDPNCAIRDTVALVAHRDIVPGEQITMDYSTCMSGDPEAGMACLCGATNCRGVIGNFEDLPSSLQLKYLQLQMVSDFIASRHRLPDE